MRAIPPEGGTQQGGSEHGGCGGQARRDQLAHSRVHGGIGRQAAGLAAQLSKHIAACTTPTIHFCPRYTTCFRQLAEPFSSTHAT